jgi:hypothetical protein
MASNTSEEKNLKEEILALTKVLDSKKQQLFLDRLIHMNLNKLRSNAKNFTITTNPELQEWVITYTHDTQDYDLSQYLPDSETAHDTSDTDPVQKTSNISFGKSGKRYFLKGGIKFNIYRNSAGELRVMNPEYDFDIDMEEHKQLIHRYSENANIPEACALAVFQYIIDNKWDDSAVINYLSIV